MMCNAGEPGQIFAGKFKLFKKKEILQMIGVYIINVLAPSLQIIQKMQPQEKQPTHGNNRIMSVIGPGWQQKYPSFRHFFACQDPLMTPPPKTHSRSTSCSDDCVTSGRRRGSWRKTS
jgi:hypothetical protein